MIAMHTCLMRKGRFYNIVSWQFVDKQENLIYWAAAKENVLHLYMGFDLQ